MSCVSVISGFHKNNLPKLWEWLHEFPERNFDDYGPSDYAEFELEMGRRIVIEKSWSVYLDDELVGAIGYVPMTARSGMTHGICFTGKVHGKGVARVAFERVLRTLFESGVEKVSAMYFSDNVQVGRFLRRCGAVHEGYMQRHTIRQGKPVDMHLVAFFKEGLCLQAAC